MAQTQTRTRKSSSSASKSRTNGGAKKSAGSPKRSANGRKPSVVERAKVPAMTGGAALLGLAGGVVAGRRRSASSTLAGGLTATARGLAALTSEVHKVQKAVSDK